MPSGWDVTDRASFVSLRIFFPPRASEMPRRVIQWTPDKPAESIKALAQAWTSALTST